LSGLVIKSASKCRWDAISLGEVMLRLDPGEGRIHTTRSFRVWEGGGEYNVARGLRRCFGLRTAIVTALCDNPVGRLIEDLMLQGGVDLTHLRWMAHDGVGRDVRNGLNFTERGFGPRGGVGCSDRARSRFRRCNRTTSIGRPLRCAWARLHTPAVFADFPNPLVAREDGASAPARHLRLLRPELPRIAVAILGGWRGRRGGQSRACPSWTWCS
jgi:hypothetical protein